MAGRAHDVIIHRLDLLLGAYIDEHDLGQVTLSQGGYDLTRPEDRGPVVWIPDFAFVRQDRAPAEDSEEWSRPWKLAPDLVVEVVSPSLYHPEMDQRARDWLSRGVRLVWIIWRDTHTVDVWQQSAGTDGQQRTLAESDSLDGLDVVAGFSCAVARIVRRVRAEP